MKTYDYRKILLLLSIGLILYPLILTAKIYLKYENARNSFSDLYPWPLPINDCRKIIEIMKEKGLKDEDFQIYERPSDPSFDPGKGRYISVRNKYFEDILGAIVEKGINLHFINPIKIEPSQGFSPHYSDDQIIRSFLRTSLLKLPYIKKCSYKYIQEGFLFKEDEDNCPSAIIIIVSEKELSYPVLEAINQLFMVYYPDRIMQTKKTAIFNEKGKSLYGDPAKLKTTIFKERKKTWLNFCIKHLESKEMIKTHPFYSDNTEYYICLSTFTSGIILLLILLLTWKDFQGRKNET